MARWLPIKERFWANTMPEPNTGCVLWMGATSRPGFKTSVGYGELSEGGKVLRAHRVAWELTRGPIPDGLFVLHRCDVTCCVNPDHLFLGTNADNVADKVAKGRQPRGETSHRAKLTREDAHRILNTPGSSMRVASMFGVSHRTVLDIRNGSHWSVRP